MNDPIPFLICSLVAVSTAAITTLVLTHEPPEKQLEVRVLRVTNTVYVPMLPPTERTPNLADLYAVPMPMYPPSIHPVITNWIYGMPLGQWPTNIIWGGSLLYTNGTAITNTLLYTNNTMRVMTEDLVWTNIWVGGAK